MSNFNADRTIRSGCWRSNLHRHYGRRSPEPKVLNGTVSHTQHCYLAHRLQCQDMILAGVILTPKSNSATKLVPYRVFFVYMACVVFITSLIPSDNDSLLGGSGITASPFVLAIQLVGIPGISSLLNAGIMCGILAISAESIYLSSRILRTMGHQKLVPQWVAHVDKRGRPLRSLLITCFTAVVLTYINLSGKRLQRSACSPTCVYTDFGVI